MSDAGMLDCVRLQHAGGGQWYTADSPINTGRLSQLGAIPLK